MYGESGTAYRSSNAKFQRNIRIPDGWVGGGGGVGGGVWGWGGGGMLFLDSVSFLGLPAFPCKGRVLQTKSSPRTGPGAKNQSSKTEPPGNIRALRGLCHFIFRGLP